MLNKHYKREGLPDKRWLCLGRVLSVLAIFIGLRLSERARAQGIPEPDYIMYGVVQNSTSNSSLPLVYGTLTWIFQLSGGPSITNILTLTNINKQFSYILTMRCESEVAGFLAASNALKLASTPTTYNRSSVTWNGLPVAFVQPSLINLTLSGFSRGVVERVDLRVAGPYGDSDENGFIDDWERFYFGHLGVDPDSDADHDGMTNLGEYNAGTDPTNPDSAYKLLLTRIFQDPLGGISVQWLSSSNQTYTVQRATNLSVGFLGLQSNILATVPTNSFRDSGATGNGPYFYRVKAQ